MSRRRFLRCIAGGAAVAAAALGVSGCRRPEQAADGQGSGDGAMANQPSGEGITQGDWDISVCGLNCAKCGLGEGEQCGGCRGPADQNWSPKCEFRPCAEAKGHRYCFECADFPCDKLEAFASDGHEHHRLTVENLKEMRAVGLDEWIARQPRVMFCPGWQS